MAVGSTSHGGFSWDRVNFLSGSWCSAVFWIWDENNVGNTLMFLVVARQSRTFQLLNAARCTGSWEGTQLRQLTQTGQKDTPRHTTSRSAYKLREGGGHGGHSK